MRVLTNCFALGHRRDHGRAEILRMRAREAYSLDSFPFGAGAQQLAEVGVKIRPEIASPGVDVLAEQRDLADAVAGESRYLRDDLAGPPGDLAAADRGNDAVRALRVAPHRDLHPRLEGPLAVHGELAG